MWRDFKILVIEEGAYKINMNITALEALNHVSITTLPSYQEVE